MSFSIGDRVRTRVSKDIYRARTFGIINDIDEEGIWVDVYYTDDADDPEDTLRYDRKDLIRLSRAM